MASEGSVYIDVNMDVSRAEKNLAKYVKELEKSADKIGELKAKTDAFMETTEWATMSKDERDKWIQSMDSQIEKAETQKTAYEKLTQAYEEWIDVQKRDAELESQNAQEKQGYIVRGGEPIRKGAEVYDVMEDLNEGVDKFKPMGENIKTVLSDAFDFVFHNMLPTMVQSTGLILGGLGKFVWNGMKWAVDTAQPLVVGLVQKAGQLTQKIGQGLKNVLTAPFRGIVGLIDRIGTRMKRMFMNVFLFNVMSKGLREMSAFFNGMVGRSAELQQSIAQIKGAIYAIVYPLAQIMLPVITRIAQFITSILVGLGKITSALSGKSWAESVAGAKAVAGSMQSASGSAQKATKTLAGIDEINQLSDDKSNGSIAPTFDFSGVEDIDLGKMLGGLKDKFDAWYKKLAEIDWKQLGRDLFKRLKKALSTVDWNGLATSASRLLGGIFGALTGFLVGFFEDIYNDVVGYFDDKIEEAGGNIVLGILAGILDAMIGILQWIYDHIFKPFIDGFKECFGISSPSTVMEEMGQYIIDGLYEGLVGIWNAVKGIFNDLVEKVKETFGKVWETVGGGASDAWEKITGAFKNVKTKFANIGSAIKDAFVNAWTKVKETALGAWNKIKEIFGNVKAFFKQTFETAWEAVKKVFSYDNLKSVAETIAEKMKGWINKLIDGMNSFLAVPFGKLKEIFDKMRNIKIAGWYPFSWLPDVTVPSIPKLAQGAVIPPNREFLATLGDNKQETEIVSPLSTMKQALLEALAEAPAQNITVVLEGDAKGVFRLVQAESRNYNARTGQPAFG
ncbi:MAG: hypothetical protein IKE23_07010 [Exiguobacterium sp.]|nr:hypothetical protein [Exiguobacterium sp.]